MAERYDERFDELTGLVTRVAGRVDEIQLEMRDMRKEFGGMRTDMSGTQTEMSGMRTEMSGMQTQMNGMQTQMNGMGKTLDRHSSRFDNLDTALQVVSGRQNDVIPKVLEIQKDVNRISETQAEQTFKMIQLMNRIDTVDRRLNVLDERTAQMDSEVKEIRKTIDSLIDPILDGKALSANMRHVEERIARLEEKVS